MWPLWKLIGPSRISEDAGGIASGYWKSNGVSNQEWSPPFRDVWPTQDPHQHNKDGLGMGFICIFGWVEYLTVLIMVIPAFLGVKKKEKKKKRPLDWIIVWGEMRKAFPGVVASSYQMRVAAPPDTYTPCFGELHSTSHFCTIFSVALHTFINYVQCFVIL